jgi:hypothetical protein
MRFAALLTASLAAGALAVESPHKRAKKFTKRAPPARREKPVVKRQSHSYLTNQTESRCFLAWRVTVG